MHNKIQFHGCPLLLEKDEEMKSERAEKGLNMDALKWPIGMLMALLGLAWRCTQFFLYVYTHTHTHTHTYTHTQLSVCDNRLCFSQYSFQLLLRDSISDQLNATDTWEDYARYFQIRHHCCYLTTRHTISVNTDHLSKCSFTKTWWYLQGPVHVHDHRCTYKGQSSALCVPGISISPSEILLFSILAHPFIFSPPSPPPPLPPYPSIAHFLFWAFIVAQGHTRLFAEPLQAIWPPFLKWKISFSLCGSLIIPETQWAVPTNHGYIAKNIWYIIYISSIRYVDSS